MATWLWKGGFVSNYGPAGGRRLEQPKVADVAVSA